MSNNTNESFWQDMLNDKKILLLLGVGLLVLLWNVLMVLGIDTRPNAWLFPLNISYWSDYFSALLWITALWTLSESLDITEDYRPWVRRLAVTGALLVMVWVWRDSLISYVNFAIGGYSPWFYAVTIMAACCLIRSLLLLYQYRYGEDEIDLEEAKWFWGVSGFIFVGLAVMGLMNIIPVKILIHAGSDDFAASTLLKVYSDGLQELIWLGTGSFVLRMFAFLLLVSSVAFIYLIGRWFLAVYLRIRGE